MKTLLWQMFGALIAGVTGLGMLMWNLERTYLLNLSAAEYGGDDTPPMRVYVSLFIGLVLVNLALFFALNKWSRFLRENPDVRQLPVWVLVTLIVVAGGSLLTAIAVHAGWMRQQDPIPLDPSLGFVFFEMFTASLVLVSLVLLAARWSPGYKPRPVTA